MNLHLQCVCCTYLGDDQKLDHSGQDPNDFLAVLVSGSSDIAHVLFHPGTQTQTRNSGSPIPPSPSILAIVTAFVLARVFVFIVAFFATLVVVVVPCHGRRPATKLLNTNPQTYPSNLCTFVVEELHACGYASRPS